MGAGEMLSQRRDKNIQLVVTRKIHSFSFIYFK